MPPFMSTAPRPYNSSPAISAENGGYFQAFSSPGGTTSVWPAKTRFGPAVPLRAYKFSTGSVSASLNVIRCTAKPAAFSVFSRNASAPPSAGVTDGQRSKSRAMATGSADTAMAPLVSQQFIDASFGTRTFIDALDDHSAV